jgi:hypothetical protein
MVLDKVSLFTKALHCPNGRTLRETVDSFNHISCPISLLICGDGMLKDIGLLILSPNQQVTQMMLLALILEQAWELNIKGQHSLQSPSKKLIAIVWGFKIFRRGPDDSSTTNFWCNYLVI